MLRFPNDRMHDIKSMEESIRDQLVRDTPLNENPTIKDFYAGREIFITGGSGFLGKVLIEKLLRSCPDVKTIFVLLRPKRGVEIEERLNKMIDIPLFLALRAMFPDFTSRIVPVDGDMTKLGLGLSDFDINRMKNVSIIFHSAASVRFDDTLKHAVLMNTRGTREVMEFAKTLPSLKVVVHVSTTYSNVYEHIVEEQLYPAVADWRKTIEVCEKTDETLLDLFTQHYINFMPNTYVFSKNLAEHVSKEYQNQLPVMIFRPSVVVGAVKEPLPGWVDNTNGPMGIFLVSALGLSKTMHCDPNNNLDMIPVDTCAKAMIVSAWKRSHEPRDSFTIYNCASGQNCRKTIQQCLDIGMSSVVKETAMEHHVFIANGGVTLSPKLNLIRCIFYQLIPAMIIDQLMQLKNMRPRIMKVQRKMFEANKALSYFVTHNWDFKNDNFTKLCTYLRDEDIRDFDYRGDFTFDQIYLLRVSLMGYRRYLLKEKDESLKRERRRYGCQEIVFRVIKYIIYASAFYYCFIYMDLLKSFRDPM